MKRSEEEKYDRTIFLATILVGAAAGALVMFMLNLWFVNNEAMKYNEVISGTQTRLNTCNKSLEYKMKSNAEGVNLIPDSI